jgi:FKBP-type peptidyl-prolyl cis-trans isomerase
MDGKVFDSSVERGSPAQFPLNQVIKGWTEGIQLMSVGSKYKFWIPSDLAYGDQGGGGVIKPGAMLIFEVELLDIVNPDSAQ